MEERLSLRLTLSEFIQIKRKIVTRGSPTVIKGRSGLLRIRLKCAFESFKIHPSKMLTFKIDSLSSYELQSGKIVLKEDLCTY